MKGILFKPDMIKAIVEGIKTQTRRVINFQPLDSYLPDSDLIKRLKAISEHTIKIQDKDNPDFIHVIPAPRYQPGEVVYIKEAFWEDSGDIYYKMDCPTMPTNMFFEKGKWKSPLSLPEIFARYFIQIVDVKPERLQEITEEDAQSEGVTRPPCYSLAPHYREWFKWLWDSINEPPYDWDSNCWVWVYSFRVLELT